MDDKERLIDYLYGEMTEAERRDFEELLARDQELRAEMESLRQTRRRLAEMPEVRPEALALAVTPPRANWKKWALRAGAAAAVLLLLSLSNARLQVGSGGLVFTMGKPAATEETNVKEELAASFQEQFSQRDRELDRKLLQLDSIWQDRLVEREGQLQRTWDRQLAAHQARRQEELKQFAQYLVTEKMPDLATLVQRLQIAQQEELRGLLSQFWSQWQATRAGDLRSIETEFVNLYRNVELNQTETQAILKDVLAARR